VRIRRRQNKPECTLEVRICGGIDWHGVQKHHFFPDLCKMQCIQQVSKDRHFFNSQLRQGCLWVRSSVMSDKVRVRPIRVNVLLTLDRVNLDLLCPRWLPHCCHIAAMLDGRGCCGRIRLAEGRIRLPLNVRALPSIVRTPYTC
jgi:hypothetical protein